MRTAFFIWILLFSSCSIDGTLQGLTSYYNKTAKRDLAISTPQELCPNSYETNDVLLYNGTDLLKCLSTKKSALVFIWAPNCKGRYCYRLQRLQALSDESNLELYVVAEYFDYEKMKLDYGLKNKLIGVDVNFYRTNFTKKYMSQFLSDLTQDKYEYGKFIQFEMGEFSRTFNSIDSLSIVN